MTDQIDVDEIDKIASDIETDTSIECLRDCRSEWARLIEVTGENVSPTDSDIVEAAIELVSTLRQAIREELQ